MFQGRPWRSETRVSRTLKCPFSPVFTKGPGNFSVTLKDSSWKETKGRVSSLSQVSDERGGRAEGINEGREEEGRTHKQ